MAASAEAQQTKKIPRIGYLSSTDSSAVSDRSAPFRQALRELGYVEGENIVIEYRYAEHERQRAHAAELVRLKVDIIVVASGDMTIRRAMTATKTIPSS